MIDPSFWLSLEAQEQIESHGKQAQWDKDFLALAEFWALRKSKDPSTKVGAVIVNPASRPVSNGVVSIGWNGFPQGIADTKERLNNRETKYDLTVHAEVNAAIMAGRDITGCTLYTWPFAPCIRCATQMVQYGIKRVVAPSLPDELRSRWGASLEASRAMFKEAGVSFKEITSWDNG